MTTSCTKRLLAQNEKSRGKARLADAVDNVIPIIEPETT